MIGIIFIFQIRKQQKHVQIYKHPFHAKKYILIILNGDKPRELKSDVIQERTSKFICKELNSGNMHAN